MALSADFQKASEDVKSLPSQPNDVLLKLYALFKQASVGDVQGSRPGLLDLKGRAKFDAWTKLKGQSSEQAQKAYVELVQSLAGA